jgi:hypothetical protein
MVDATMPKPGKRGPYKNRDYHSGLPYGEDEMALLTADHVRAILRKEVKRAGSQAAWGRKYGIAPAVVSNTLSGSRLPIRPLRKNANLTTLPRADTRA